MVMCVGTNGTAAPVPSMPCLPQPVAPLPVALSPLPLSSFAHHPHPPGAPSLSSTPLSLSPLSPSPTSGFIIPSSPIGSPLVPCPGSPVSPIGLFNPLIITPSSWQQSYGMEHVWFTEFNRLFGQFFPHMWFMCPVEQRPIGGTSTLHTFVDSAKVRFCCDKCGHGWTSMKGRVAFWFDLYISCGIVTFKLYGQQCDRCKADRYEQPMWYPEEVFKVIVNVYNRVGQVFYGFYCPPIDKARRAGKPRTPHNADLCQACRDGLCADRK